MAKNTENSEISESGNIRKKRSSKDKRYRNEAKGLRDINFRTLIYLFILQHPGISKKALAEKFHVAPLTLVRATAGKSLEDTPIQLEDVMSILLDVDFYKLSREIAVMQNAISQYDCTEFAEKATTKIHTSRTFEVCSDNPEQFSGDTIKKLLRDMWTAYCNQKKIGIDSAEYNIILWTVWNGMGTKYFSTFEEFYHFMSENLT